jgi:hypothetical protein
MRRVQEQEQEQKEHEKGHTGEQGESERGGKKTH